MSKPKIYLPVSKEEAVVPAQYRKHRIQVELVILRSKDPDALPEDWEPVYPKHVPYWLKEHGIVKAMVEGQMVQKQRVDPYWYRAEKIAQAEEMPPPEQVH